MSEKNKNIEMINRLRELGVNMDSKVSENKKDVDKVKTFNATFVFSYPILFIPSLFHYCSYKR